MKKLFFFILVLNITNLIQAQDLTYQIGVHHFFDNREVQTPYSDPQTLFGIRISPELVWVKSDMKGALHQIKAGVHYLQPIGASLSFGQFDPILYYRYGQKNLKLHFGIIPYNLLVEKLPIHILSDSLSYFYPNINGSLIQYQAQKGFFEAMLDWRGAMSQTTREAFRVILKGRYYFNRFSVGGYAFLNHLANKAPTEPKEGVCDNYLMAPELGFHLTKNNILDTTSLRISYIFSSTRERITNTTIQSQGIGLDLFLKWRFLAFQNTLYIGNNMMPFYNQYGSTLHLGDPYYRAPQYNRTSCMFYLIKNDFVTCLFSWNFHFIKGYPIGHQQLLQLKIDMRALSFKN